MTFHARSGTVEMKSCCIVYCQHQITTFKSIFVLRLRQGAIVLELFQRRELRLPELRPIERQGTIACFRISARSSPATQNYKAEVFPVLDARTGLGVFCDILPRGDQRHSPDRENVTRLGRLDSAHG